MTVSPRKLEATTRPDLFSPLDVHGLALKNRVVMPALTRKRALNPDLAPTELMAQMYAQRASAGLIISEGTWVSPEGVGFMDAPGLFTREQIAGWRKVTDAVHRRGGVMFAQISHAGFMSQPTLFGGKGVASPRRPYTADDGQTPATPRAMTREGIGNLIKEFADAARNAKEAGFDGVQVQCSFVYVVAQFLHSAVNLRKDAYGGTTENRARLLFDILDAVSTALRGQNVGAKFGPADAEGAMAANSDTIDTFEHVLRRLDTYSLAHVMVSNLATDVRGTAISSLAGDAIFSEARKFYKGVLMINGNLDPDRANRMIAEGIADLAAFGRIYISNPDLVERLRSGVPLTPPDVMTFYRGRRSPADGYIDYPGSELSPR